MLRAAALPLDRVRRSRAARRRGLQGDGPVQRGLAARDRVRRADLRRVGGPGLEGRGRAGRRGRGDDRGRRTLRADSQRHPGDPAAEDASRRDLRRAHAGLHGIGEHARGRRPARRAGLRGRSAGRSLPHVRPGDPGGVPRVDAGPGRCAPRPRRGPVGRDREPRAVRGRGRARPPAARHTERGRPRVRAPGRRGVRRVIRAPGPAGRADREREHRVRDDRAAQRGPRGRLHDLPHVPARVARDAHAPRGIRGRDGPGRDRASPNRRGAGADGAGTCRAVTGAGIVLPRAPGDDRRRARRHRARRAASWTTTSRRCWEASTTGSRR